MPQPYYITTPIYYVNDRPHIGHGYTTLVADAAARFARLAHRDVWFLTGTDEHAEKVVESAAAHGVTPIQWADRNAQAFQEVFGALGCSNDDFIRTTQKRHKSKVERYVRRLLESGDVALGDYEGWWDPSQEEYITEAVAKEHQFKSPVTGRDLVRRTEQNYFFDLPKYADRLREHIQKHPGFILPEARRNEIMGRIDAGLQRVPVSRAIKADDTASQWGIRMPGDPGHRIYVWIDALFNYMSAIDDRDEGGAKWKYWPATVHVMAKDIIWFHAVIWPAMLMALGEPLPGCIYAHSFWIREGRKMSKSLGNFLDGPTIDAYRKAFSTDAWRWHMLTQGPLGATDADFVHAKFVEVYNADLANGIGNAASRVSNMIEKYFGGQCPDPGPHGELHAAAASIHETVQSALGQFDITAALQAGLGLTRKVDAYIHTTEPFKLAKDGANMPRVASILYDCAEALRIAAVLLSPAMPVKMADLLQRFGQAPPDAGGRFALPLADVCAWGGLRAGTPIVKGEALFPRWDTANPAPQPE